VACVIAAPISPALVKLRQMAVATEYQRQGLGQAFLRGMATVLLGEGVTTLILNSRLFAVGFYRRLGYATHGECLVEIVLPHVQMRK
jgi:predicted GNAT family acetyltransferase